MSFFNNLLGTQDLGGKQKLQAGLMAMLPMVQGGGGGVGGSLGRLFQGMGQARGWASHQLPPAPTVAPMTPGQLPSPVPVPQGPTPILPMPQGMPSGGPSVLPPAPNQGLGQGTTGAPNMDPRRVQQFSGGMMNLGFGGLGMGW